MTSFKLSSRSRKTNSLTIRSQIAAFKSSLLSNHDNSLKINTGRHSSDIKVCKKVKVKNLGGCNIGITKRLSPDTILHYCDKVIQEKTKKFVIMTDEQGYRYLIPAQKLCEFERLPPLPYVPDHQPLQQPTPPLQSCHNPPRQGYIPYQWIQNSYSYCASRDSSEASVPSDVDMGLIPTMSGSSKSTQSEIIPLFSDSVPRSFSDLHLLIKSSGMDVDPPDFLSFMVEENSSSGGCSSPDKIFDLDGSDVHPYDASKYSENSPSKVTNYDYTSFHNGDANYIYQDAKNDSVDRSLQESLQPIDPDILNNLFWTLGSLGQVQSPPVSNGRCLSSSSASQFASVENLLNQ